MDYMVSATTTPCGHMFCETCIFEWNLFNRECPICRQSDRRETPHPCPMMNTLVEGYLQQPALGKDLDSFLARRRKFEQWKDNKTYPLRQLTKS